MNPRDEWALARFAPRTSWWVYCATAALYLVVAWLVDWALSVEGDGEIAIVSAVAVVLTVQRALRLRDSWRPGGVVPVAALAALGVLAPGKVGSVFDFLAFAFALTAILAALSEREPELVCDALDGAGDPRSSATGTRWGGWSG